MRADLVSALIFRCLPKEYIKNLHKNLSSGKTEKGQVEKYLSNVLLQGVPMGKKLDRKETGVLNN